MKKTKNTDYRTYGTEKITAPIKPKDEPKAVKTTADGDLRGGKK